MPISKWAARSGPRASKSAERLNRMGSWTNVLRQICRTKRIHWQKAEAEAFYAEHHGQKGDRFGEAALIRMSTGKFYFPRLVLAMSEPFLALALGKMDAIKQWRSLIGPTHVYRAQWQNEDSLRARYGISGEAVVLDVTKRSDASSPRHSKCLPWLGQPYYCSQGAQHGV